MKYATKSNTDPTSKHTAPRSKAATMASLGSDAIAQRKMANAVNNSPQMVTQREVAESIHQSPQMTTLRESSHGLPIQREAEPAAATNTTGLPDGLKAGIESMSGISMDNVSVTYNSPEPAKINALAYTQGSKIHVAPGQEKYLPHETWHVVQQAQGRVQATMQMKGVAVNDDAGLEHEADVMGAKAASFSAQSQTAPETREVALDAAAPVQCTIAMPKEKDSAFDALMNARREHPEAFNSSDPKHPMIKDLIDVYSNTLATLDKDKIPAFWSGPGARVAAEADHTVFRLADLSMGEAAVHVVTALGLHGDESLEVWTNVSKALANAVGMRYGHGGPKSGEPVYAFISTAVNPNGVWATKEEPLLKTYGVNIVKKFCDTQGNLSNPSAATPAAP